MDNRLTIDEIDSVHDYCRETLIPTYPENDIFYVMDIGVVERKIDEWYRLLPRVSPFYAVKCMNDKGLLQTLVKRGVGFDCASPTEITTMMRDYNVSSDRIIYANPMKPKRHICMARDVGLQTTTFDNESELRKLKEYWPDAKCVLRIKVDDITAQCQLGNKYGALYDEIEPLLQLAKTLNMYVEGISFHVGSNANDTNAFSRAIMAARVAFDIAEHVVKLPNKMTLLDIGGGFSGVKALDSMAEVINKALNEYFNEDQHVRIIAEPGRFFAERMATLCASVIAKRVRSKDLHEYWLMDGLYGSFNCIIYDHANVTGNPLFGVSHIETEKHQSTLYGPTCDGLDVITTNIMLPDLMIGEWLVFDNMGAYTRSACTQFNGFSTTDTPTYYVRSKNSLK